MTYSRLNPNLFTTTNAGKKELDDELNNVVSDQNDLLDKINAVESDGISGVDDHGNINKFPTTDGTNLLWKKIDADSVTPRSLGEAQIVSASLNERVMGVSCIGPDQLQPNAVTTAKIAPAVVTDAKMAVNSIQLNKMRSSGYSSLVVGRNADYQYEHLLVSTNYTMPTLMPGDGKPSMQSLGTLWGVQGDGSLAGTKITDGSLSGTKVTDATITGAKLANATITGNKIADATIPLSKLQGVPPNFQIFAYGYKAFQGDEFFFNVASCVYGETTIGTLFTVTFQTQAPSNRYLVFVTPTYISPGGGYFYYSPGTQTTEKFNILSSSNGHSFNFIVYLT